MNIELFTITLDNKSSNPVFSEHPKEYVNRGIQMPFLLGFNHNEGIFFIRSNFFGGNKEVHYILSCAHILLINIFLIISLLSLLYFFLQCNLLRIIQF